MKKWLFATAIGAALAYFLDPKAGSARRTSVLGQASTAMGRVPANDLTSTVKSTVKSTVLNRQQDSGQAHETAPRPHDNTNPDDLTLRDRVETEIFADEETSRENININVVDRIVEVRGELPTQQEIDALIQRIQGIRDVDGVHSYLHLPGTVAPNKASAIEAS